MKAPFLLFFPLSMEKGYIARACGRGLASALEDGGMNSRDGRCERLLCAVDKR